MLFASFVSIAAPLAGVSLSPSRPAHLLQHLFLPHHLLFFLLYVLINHHLTLLHVAKTFRHDVHVFVRVHVPPTNHPGSRRSVRRRDPDARRQRAHHHHKRNDEEVSHVYFRAVVGDAVVSSVFRFFLFFLFVVIFFVIFFVFGVVVIIVSFVFLLVSSLRLLRSPLRPWKENACPLLLPFLFFFFSVREIPSSREAADADEDDDVKSKLCSSSCFWEVLEANPPLKVDARTFLPGEISSFYYYSCDAQQTGALMLFSDGACSRRVSLFKFFLFCAQLERERERVGSWERAGEFCLRCFVLFCVECRGREEREAKQLSSFLGILKKKKRILGMSSEFLKIYL